MKKRPVLYSRVGIAVIFLSPPPIYLPLQLESRIAPKHQTLSTSSLIRCVSSCLHVATLPGAYSVFGHGRVSRLYLCRPSPQHHVLENEPPRKRNPQMLMKGDRVLNSAAYLVSWG